MERLPVYLAFAQGVYFFITGVWPLVHMKSFMAVTGPKVDEWLVNAVGVLVAVIGVVLLMAGGRGAVSGEVWVLAVGSAAGLAAIDVVYSLKGRISKIYLLDAAVEVVLIAGWLVLFLRG